MEKSIRVKPRKIFGYHLALDLYGCDSETMHDLDRCYQFLDTLPAKIGMHKQSPPFVIYIKNQGMAGWVPIVESGFSLYSVFSNNFISVDLYSCKRFDSKELTEIIVRLFKPNRIKSHFLLRGREYIHPMKLLKQRGLI
jgi:S-adenosylmethionine decarboxylase